jgi:hypothetical protein
VEWEYTRGGFCKGRSLSTVESIPVGEKRGQCMVVVLEFGLVDAAWELSGERFLEAAP